MRRAAAGRLLKATIGRLVRSLFQDYTLNWILRSPDRPVGLPLLPNCQVRPFDAADEPSIRESGDAKFRSTLGYERDGATGFMLADDGEPACIAHFVDRDRYHHSTIWPLADDQTALVNIVTRSASRGMGLAPVLIDRAAPLALAGRSGYALCFVWWNHQASLRAFRRAGWRKIGFSAELIHASGRRTSLRFPLRGCGDSLVSPSG